MNRIEYMTELASLLQDIPVEERREAMRYYNAYLDDAGEENEQQAISELGSPEKVAETIKEGLGIFGKEKTEFQSNDSESVTQDKNQTQWLQQPYQEQNMGKNTWKQKLKDMDPVLRIILIIAIVVIAGPIVLPVVLGIAGAIAGVLLAIIFTILSVIIAAVAILIAGIILFGVGVVNLVPEAAVGLALVGIGLLLMVLGLIVTVGSIKFCIWVFPISKKGIVWIWNKLFHRKAVA